MQSLQGTGDVTEVAGTSHTDRLTIAKVWVSVSQLSFQKLKILFQYFLVFLVVEG